MHSSKILAILLLVLMASLLVVIAFYKNLAIYVTIIAIGLAVALQKYVSSYFGYFVISLTRIFSIGDRIRIGNTKGDVMRIGLFHFVLEEVGEDEKLGGELTGRILHIPNLVVLDQPVVNYSKNYSIKDDLVKCEYIFDELRIPLTPQSNVDKAIKILEKILRNEDLEYVEKAKAIFQADYPHFMKEAEIGPLILVHIEPQRIWVKGKFITPFRTRNELRTKIYLEFIREASKEQDIHLA